MRRPTVQIVLLTGSLATAAVDAAVDVPVVRDPRLQLELLASDPDIVTPVGITADARGRIFVVESHTHARSRSYDGPKGDRVKLLVDSDRDGRPDRITVFADDLKLALTVAVSPAGRVYVCHRNGVILLHDRDDDGRSEARTEVVKLATREGNNHGCLLGITFSPDNWLYVSRGNVGGHRYTLTGSDGSRVSGYGDGGNIVRCRPDGTELHEVATGFWNPFDMEFDAYGRLFCVDNDPDARGPNRLVHVIFGGDYGFKALFGPSGLHPYQGWNGELPGTLPMMAGLGEAPTGVLDCARAALPTDYSEDLLVTVWGTHEIVRCRTRRAGASFEADTEVVVKGTRLFRPVDMAVGVDGAVYITDWVKRDYPVHGKGRIWRLSTRPGENTIRPRAPYGKPKRDDNRNVQGLHHLLGMRQPGAFETLSLLRIVDTDPFIRSATITALARSVSREHLVARLDDETPAVRLTCLLALRRGGHADPAALLRKRLADSSEDVRRIALLWAGEAALTELRDDIDKVLTAGPISPELFRTYLATTQVLGDNEIEARRKGTKGFQIKRTVRTDVLRAILGNASHPAELRSIALRFLTDTDSRETLKLLGRLVENADSPVRREAIKTLSLSASPAVGAILEHVALDGVQDDATLRADAIAGLALQPPERLVKLTGLLQDPLALIRLAAARTLGVAADHPPIRDALERTRRVLQQRDDDPALAAQLAFTLSPPTPGGDGVSRRPKTDAEWLAALETPGDPDAGRRVFFHPQVRCAECHRVRGRGSPLGPDLSYIARSIDRERLIRSILEPSDEVAPEFQFYNVLMKDGRVLTGTQWHFRGLHAASLILSDGTETRLRLDEVEAHEPARLSYMPDDLEQSMSVAEFRDLVAFLMAMK